jgi:hypothetical protein
VNSRDQVILAGRLNAALLAAGLVVTHNQRVPGGRSVRVPAELVDVVGWLARGDYWIEESGSTVLPPARPHLVREGKP